MQRFLAVPLIALALGAAACGDDKSSGDSTAGTEAAEAPAAADLYAQAVNKLDTMGSGKLDARLEATIGTDDITIEENGGFTGATGTALPQFDIRLASTQSSGRDETAIVNTGDALYIKPDGATEFENQGKEAVDLLTRAYAREQGELGPGRIPMLALTPGDWAVDPQNEGTETVDGETMQRIVAKLDVPKFLADLRTAKDADIGMGVTLSGAATELEKPGAQTDTATLTALVGQEDGTLHRLTAAVAGTDPVTVKIDFDVQLTETGEPQTITAP